MRPSGECRVGIDPPGRHAAQPRCAALMTLCATASPCFRTMCESGRRLSSPVNTARCTCGSAPACRPRKNPDPASRRIAARTASAKPSRYWRAMRVARARPAPSPRAGRCCGAVCTSWPRRRAQAGGVRHARSRDRPPARRRRSSAASTASSASRSGIGPLEWHRAARRPRASGAHSSTMPRLVLQPAAAQCRRHRAPRCARPPRAPGLNSGAAAASRAGDEHARPHAVPGRSHAHVAGLAHRHVELAGAQEARLARPATPARFMPAARAGRLRGGELAVEQVVDDARARC